MEEEDTGGYLIVKLTLHSCPSIATLSIHVKCCSYHQREREGTLKKKAKYPNRKEKEGGPVVTQIPLPTCPAS